ncbi:MAG: MGMT family protein [Coriobacteriales bacterium]|nr:MGMT family protein [Coriobacteriales bacterium]
MSPLSKGSIVPLGWTATYGNIGKLAGYPRAARQVGLALSQVRRIATFIQAET